VETAARHLVVDPIATNTVKDMARLGLLQRASQSDIEELLTYQGESGKSLAQILREPVWLQRLGLSADSFKATWYAANPYDLLPVDLQIAIRKTQKPFESRTHINKWLAAINAPARWVQAVDLALIETTPINLWRASRGQKPFAKNGQYLQPIVVEKERGIYEVRDGHIATDPSIIPTNSHVLLSVKVNGKYHLIKVKASDIGEGIKGHHVDLPIAVKPRYTKNHAIQFPGKYIGNPNVLILVPQKKVSRGQKA
jgi:3D (Asp-Asp-Asp) domain-containing protein